MDLTFPGEVRKRRMGRRMLMIQEPLLDRIAVAPEVMAGQPVIRGTRLTVAFVLGLLARGVDAEEILREYEGLAPIPSNGCCQTESLRPA